MTPDEKRERAQKRIEEERSFYTHLITYVAVNAFLVALNLITSPNHLWFFWPMLGWGIGLILHGFGTFGKHLVLGKKWEERRMEQLMRRDD